MGALKYSAGDVVGFADGVFVVVGAGVVSAGSVVVSLLHAVPAQAAQLTTMNVLTDLRRIMGSTLH